jgi:hypothetical protein
MSASASEQVSSPLSQAALDEIVSTLAAHEGLTYVLSVSDDVSDIALDAFGPDPGNACWLVASLSHVSPKPHRIGTKAEPIREEESVVLECVKRLRDSGANFVLAWRSSQGHLARVAHSPEWTWKRLRAELSELMLFNHP